MDQGRNQLKNSSIVVQARIGSSREYSSSPAKEIVVKGSIARSAEFISKEQSSSLRNSKAFEKGQGGHKGKRD